MSTTHHAFDYVEIEVASVERAKEFYAAAFGWTFTDYGPDYAGIRAADGDGEVGGLAATTDRASSRAGVRVLLFSDDLDATVAGVEAAGGSVTEPAYAFPGGRRAFFTDPDGNELGAWSTS